MSSQIEDWANKCLYTCNCAVFTYITIDCASTAVTVYCVLVAIVRCLVLIWKWGAQQDLEFMIIIITVSRISALFFFCSSSCHIFCFFSSCSTIVMHNAPICRHMHLFLLTSWAPKHEQGNVSKQVPCDLQLCTMHRSADACIFFLLISWAPKHEQGNICNKCRGAYSCEQCTDLQMHASFPSHEHQNMNREHKQVSCDLQLCTTHRSADAHIFFFSHCDHQTWTRECKQVPCDLKLCTMHRSVDAHIFFFSHPEHQNMNRET